MVFLCCFKLRLDVVSSTVCSANRHFLKHQKSFFRTNWMPRRTRCVLAKRAGWYPAIRTRLNSMNLPLLFSLRNLRGASTTWIQTFRPNRAAFQGVIKQVFSTPSFWFRQTGSWMNRSPNLSRQSVFVAILACVGIPVAYFKLIFFVYRCICISCNYSFIEILLFFLQKLRDL